MRIHPTDRAKLRQLLEQIPTDPDFDGFCLDYFPEVYRRIGAGMDRAAKINLLFQLVPDPELVVAKLTERYPTCSQKVPESASRKWFVVGLAAAVVVCLAWSLATGKDAPTPIMEPLQLSLPAVTPVTDGGHPSRFDAAASPSQADGTIVEHTGDIQAKGSVNIGAPFSRTQTVVRTRGEILAGGNVQIGVTATSAPIRRKE